MQANAMDTLLKADEVTRMLGISRRTFEALIGRKEGPSFLFVGRQRRWRPCDVEGWIDKLTREAMQERISVASTPTGEEIQ